ncbi:MAG: ABC transporter ATP-binding protein [Lachnospiraceae bacterium]|nr:ABC transporter ATP-binding protein [Lachnospiraceae bacterium]
MEHAIEIRHLSKEYKDFRLQDVSLNIPTGTVMGLIGANGAGKSTFINSILGLVNSDYKMLRIFGKDLRTQEKEIKEDIAVIFDVSHYNPEFTPAFIGKMLSRVYKNWDMTIYEQYLEEFHLPKRKKLKQYSKGMKMKLEFAIAFSHAPKLLILDEATSGLDPIFREEILDIIRKYTEDEDHTVLLSSHITSDLDKIADYIAFIHEGQLLFVKTYDEIQENFGIINCRKELFDSLNPEDILSYRRESYGYKVMIESKQELRKIFPDLEIENASIEDLMLFQVKGEHVPCQDLL